MDDKTIKKNLINYYKTSGIFDVLELFNKKYVKTSFKSNDEFIRNITKYYSYYIQHKYIANYFDVLDENEFNRNLNEKNNLSKVSQIINYFLYIIFTIDLKYKMCVSIHPSQQFCYNI